MNRIKIEIVGIEMVEIESSKEYIQEVENRARKMMKDIRKGEI